MKERMQRFMAGRYGNDQLNQFIFIVAIISMVLEIITRQSLFYTLTLVLLILAYVRVFSRNINKRYEENMKFLQKKDAILYNKSVVYFLYTVGFYFDRSEDRLSYLYGGMIEYG